MIRRQTSLSLSRSLSLARNTLTFPCETCARMARPRGCGVRKQQRGMRRQKIATGTSCDKIFYTLRSKFIRNILELFISIISKQLMYHFLLLLKSFDFATRVLLRVLSLSLSFSFSLSFSLFLSMQK